MSTGRAVLFDLDGTLVDTAGDLVAALYVACDRFSIERPGYDDARRAVANGGAGLIALGFPDSDEAQRKAALEILLTHYASNIADRSSLYPALPELLETFKQQQVPWGVVTNKPEALTRPLLDALSIQPTRNCIVGGDSLMTRKPDPAPLVYAAGLLGVLPHHCIYVGDHKRDIDAARAANMRTIAAAYGYVAHDDDPSDWDADHCAQESGALQQLLTDCAVLLAPDSVRHA
ncbi:MAG: HAD-IA family hydrolase [Pseudomonadota bacterium]